MIQLINIDKSYKSNCLFNSMNLQIKKGEICGIKGKNGIGKSILLKMIAGLVCPDSGKIIVDGIEIQEGEFPYYMGVILDCTGFLTNKSGFDNLKLIASVRNEIDDTRIREVMSLVTLDPCLKLNVGKYSLGMKQKLAFAQALMEYPKLLLLDEPFNGIDDKSEKIIKDLLLKLNKEQNTTIVITSHNDNILNELCTKKYRIENNNIQLIPD